MDYQGYAQRLQQLVIVKVISGMMLSLLGVTAHVFASNGTCIRSFAFELVELDQRHTAAYVHLLYKEMLKKHNLSERRVLRVVTDCGSNMVKAFL